MSSKKSEIDKLHHITLLRIIGNEINKV